MVLCRNKNDGYTDYFFVLHRNASASQSDRCVFKIYGPVRWPSALAGAMARCAGPVRWPCANNESSLSLFFGLLRDGLDDIVLAWLGLDQLVLHLVDAAGHADGHHQAVVTFATLDFINLPSLGPGHPQHNLAADRDQQAQRAHAARADAGFSRVDAGVVAREKVSA